METRKKAHLASHEDPHLECDICGKMFRKKKGLEAHMNVHKGIRDFKCIPCNRVSFHFFGYFFSEILTANIP